MMDRSNSSDKLRIPPKLYAVFIGVGTVLIGIVVYALHLGMEIAGQYAVLVDAAKEIRYETTNAHLRFEQVLRSGKTTEIADIWESQKRSEALNRALLEGGEFRENRVSSIEDPELRGRLYDLLGKQKDFYEVIEDRWNIFLADQDAYRMESLTEGIYSDFVASAAGVEDRLKQVIELKLGRFRMIQYFMIVLTLICVIGMGWVLRVFIRRREKQNERLRESEERFRLLVENARDMVILVDVKTEQIVDVNSEACHVLGYSRKELLFKSLREIETESSFQQRNLNSKTVRKGEKFLIDTQFMTKEGRTFPAEVNVGVIEMDQELFCLGIVRDISERKQMEDDLRLAKEAAEDANYAKSAFLANMSHEVRTPINGVMGMLQLMETTKLSREQNEYVGVAIHSCRSLTTLLSDILDLSRVEAGKVEIVREVFNLHEMMESLKALYQPQVNADGIELTFDVAPNIPDKLWGDSGRLNQIISNLVGNSMKFTEKGGILLKVEPVESEFNDIVDLQFMVADTGIGIPEAQIRYIFDAFRQVDGSYTRKHQGAGLGLSIVKKLLDLMKGSVSVSSRVGVGTTFLVIIPFEVYKGEASDLDLDVVHEHGNYKGKRALVVDDHEINRMSVTQLLNKMGIETSCACTGKEALAILQSRAFDFALMDIQMPEMDGVSVTAEIRNNDIYQSKELPIIAMTAHAMEGDRERFMRAGMDGYIAKPFEVGELKGSIEQVLEKRKRRDT
jgi:PAS domain S-box-containing protein